MRPSRLAACLVAVLVAGCGTDGGDTPEQAFLADYRAELDELLGEDTPDYTDEELLTFGRRACENLEQVEDGETLRRTIEGASVGASDAETLQVAQATVLVTSAAEHLCPAQGERLDLVDEDAEA